MKNEREFLKVEIDTHVAEAVDKLIQNGLVASGAASDADNNNVSLRTVSVALDPVVARHVDGLLRDGLVASGAASDADNNNVSLMIAKKP